MSTSYQQQGQAMPVLTKIALYTTAVASLLLVVAFPIMVFQRAIGILIVLIALFAWLIASFSGLFGVAQAQPKGKAVYVLLFSLLGPLLVVLLTLVLLALLS